MRLGAADRDVAIADFFGVHANEGIIRGVSSRIQWCRYLLGWFVNTSFCLGWFTMLVLWAYVLAMAVTLVFYITDPSTQIENIKTDSSVHKSIQTLTVAFSACGTPIVIYLLYKTWKSTMRLAKRHGCGLWNH